jgi:hypothetical protein
MRSSVRSDELRCATRTDNPGVTRRSQWAGVYYIDYRSISIRERFDCGLPHSHISLGTASFYLEHTNA